MVRLVRVLTIVLLVALALPAAAAAAPRMWMGFQDDLYFRWLPEREHMRDLARDANATVVKTTVGWYSVAEQQPANAADPFDPAYNWNDVDEFVREAQDRDLEVLLTVYGTPSWAGPARNQLPRRLADLQDFARAMATRYSGRYPSFPFVRFYSVWNEPNLNLFLSPQYVGSRSVGPALYAQLFRAAYTGFKLGSPTAQVALGETSARKVSTSPSHAPARFAELLSKVRPKLRFDAYAHHPYGNPANQPPTQKVAWPNVSMSSLTRFGASLDKWFGRKNIPLWLTEYGHETRPEDPVGVSYAQQASYLQTAFAMAKAQPRVQMLIWFVLRDEPRALWQSGLMTLDGLAKPALARFSALAKPLDARNQILTVKAGRANPAIRIPTSQLTYRTGVGAKLGVVYEVFERGRRIAAATPEAFTARDGWITIRPRFTPARGRTYRLTVDAHDINRNHAIRTVTLVGVK